jgi:hypothetical protein
MPLRVAFVVVGVPVCHERTAVRRLDVAGAQQHAVPGLQLDAGHIDNHVASELQEPRYKE